jgi:hypothetical protein
MVSAAPAPFNLAELLGAREDQVLAEEIDGCASAAGAARAPKSRSPTGCDPERPWPSCPCRRPPSSRPSTPLHCRPWAKKPRRYHRGCQWPSTALIGEHGKCEREVAPSSPSTGMTSRRPARNSALTKEEMSVARDPQCRPDLHSISINFGVASRGRCGFTHLDRGRVYQLPHRHRGPCDLRPQNRECAGPN